MRKKLYLMAAVIVGTLLFAACNKTEPQPAPVSEVVSEVISETVSAEPSEEISEEPVAEELDYSAEAITKIGDEISNDVKYLTRDQIDSFIIAANLDHISDEDLETLLSTNGYTLESLNDSYIAGLKTMRNFRENVINYQVGNDFNQEQLDAFNNEKIDFSKIIISDEYVDEVNLLTQLYYGKSDNYDAMWKLELDTSEKTTISDIAYGGTIFDIDYDEEIENPYNR